MATTHTRLMTFAEFAIVYKSGEQIPLFFAEGSAIAVDAIFA